MSRQQPLVTVFGASGFLGRHVVRRLAKEGWRIRAASRYPALANYLKPLGDVGQIALIKANVLSTEDVAAAVRGADAAVNLVGILYQSGAQRFDTIHARAAGEIAQAAKAARVSHLVQMSAIGADPESPSHYARSKAQGEAWVREACPNAVILRPSVVFGPEDQFFNRFAGLARALPFLPLFGGGRNRMQPVFAGDVAAAVAEVLSGHGSPKAQGRTYELGGPQTYTFRELMEFVSRETMRKPFLLPIPFWMGHIGAAFAGLLPTPPITRDQLRLLAKDNVVKAGPDADRVFTFAELGIVPAPAEAIVPTYLYAYRHMGQFAAERKG